MDTALLPCPDCEHQVSPLASTCPSCAAPLEPAGRFRATPGMVSSIATGVACAFGMLLMAVGTYLLIVFLRSADHLGEAFGAAIGGTFALHLIETGFVFVVGSIALDYMNSRMNAGLRRH